MINVLGLPLETAVRLLREAGVEPEIIGTRGFREAAEGTQRVIRVSEDGRRLTVARFPDSVRLESVSADEGEA